MYIILFNLHNCIYISPYLISTAFLSQGQSVLQGTIVVIFVLSMRNSKSRQVNVPKSCSQQWWGWDLGPVFLTSNSYVPHGTNDHAFLHLPYSTDKVHLVFPWGISRFIQIGTSQSSSLLIGLSERAGNVPFEESDMSGPILISFFSLCSMIHWPQPEFMLKHRILSPLWIYIWICTWLIQMHIELGSWAWQGESFEPLRCSRERPLPNGKAQY